MKAYTDEEINAVLDQKPNVIDTVTFDRTRFEAWYIEQGKRTRDLSLPYKSTLGALVKFRQDGSGYGVNDSGHWFDNSCWGELTERKLDKSYYWQPATVEEWESILLEQAGKRGYNESNYRCLNLPDSKAIFCGNFYIHNGNVWQGKNPMSISDKVFDAETGKWAEIIEQPTVDLVSAVQMIADKLEMNINVK